jgi:ferredoxin
VSEIITRTALVRLSDDWIAAGKAVAGPCRSGGNRVGYAQLAAGDRLVFDGFLRPWNSIKEFVFPRHEELFRYRREGNRVELVDAVPDSTERLILGARPCDAAALPILDPLFNWDYRDEFYNRRRSATTVVTLACTTFDDNCFCTSVGLSPAAERGSDAMILPLGGDVFEVRCFTEKGRALFAGRTETSGETAVTMAGPEPIFRPETVADYAERNFEGALWEASTLACLGCGACAYTCPTCHCFDMVDEGGVAAGARVKNWDSCQFGLFTLHASGHNPRTVQPQRQRQRIYHKFRIYPEKFNEVLCTGCGSCARNCPVGLGVLNVLRAIETDHGEHIQA